jgi:hypothetical protein
MAIRVLYLVGRVLFAIDRHHLCIRADTHNDDGQRAAAFGGDFALGVPGAQIEELQR